MYMHIDKGKEMKVFNLLKRDLQDCVYNQQILITFFCILKIILQLERFLCDIKL